MEKTITATKGDANGTIDDLIKFLNIAKENGGTNYRFTWSHDPVWSFKWFEIYAEKSEEQVKQEQIDRLEKEIEELKKS